MTQQLFSLGLARQIVQIRFRPTLEWIHLRPVITSQLEKQYEEWATDKKGNIALYSPKSKNSLEVFTNQITHIVEKDIDLDNALKHIVKISSEIFKECSVREVRRLGCRRIIIMQSKFKFNELTELLHKRLFNSSKEIISLQVGKINDLAYVLDTLSDGFKIHVQIGAVAKEEAYKLFDAKFDTNNEIKTEGNLFIDIDVSKADGLTTGNVGEIISKIQSQNKNTFENYLNYLSG